MATMGRVRRLALGMLMGLAVAVALLGTGAPDVSAQPIMGVKEQGEFVDTCRELGGTSQSVGPRTVKCKYQNGAAITCNFANGGNPDACVTYVPPTARTTGGGHEPGGSQTSGGGQGSGAAGSSAASDGAAVVADAPASDAGTDRSMIPLE